MRLLSSNTYQIPANVLEFLEGDNSKILSQIYVYNKNKSLDDLRDIADNLLNKKVRIYYDKIFKVGVPVFNFLLEPLKNANFYSDNKNQPIGIDLLLSPKALVSSFSDGGSYFKREDVKREWESKTKPSDKYISEEKDIGKGLGTMIIYEMADLIFVDTNQNKLYLGLSTDGRFFEKRS